MFIQLLTYINIEIKEKEFEIVVVNWGKKERKGFYDDKATKSRYINKNGIFLFQNVLTLW